MTGRNAVLRVRPVFFITPPRVCFFIGILLTIFRIGLLLYSRLYIYLFHPDSVRPVGWAPLLVCVITFDMLSPEYDIPASIDEFRDWFEANGLSNIDVHFGYNGIEGRGVKPMAATSGPTQNQAGKTNNTLISCVA